MLLTILVTAAMAANPIVRDVKVRRDELKKMPIRVECPVGQTTRIIFPEPVKKVQGPEEVRPAFGFKMVAQSPRGIVALRPPRAPATAQVSVLTTTLTVTLILTAVAEGLSSDLEIVLIGEPAPAAPPESPAPAPQTRREPSPPESRPSAPTRETRKEAVPTTQPRPSRAPAAAPPSQTRLEVTAVPWADVTLDDQAVGRTPLTIPVTAGRHTLRFMHPEYVTYTRLVDVAERQTASVGVNLPVEGFPLAARETPPTRLDVNAVPWADVALDDQAVGRTPLTIPVAAGRHTLRFSHPEYLPYKRLVDVEEGQTASVVVNLPIETVPVTKVIPEQKPEQKVEAKAEAPEATVPGTGTPAAAPEAPLAPPSESTSAAESPIDSIALALAKPVHIGREEGLPGQPVAVLDDALKGDDWAWFRFRIKGLGGREIERVTLHRKGETRDITAIVVDRSGKDLRVVVQVSRNLADQHARIGIKVLEGPVYRFPLDAPLLHNFIRSLW